MCIRMQIALNKQGRALASSTNNTSSNVFEENDRKWNKKQPNAVFARLFSECYTLLHNFGDFDRTDIMNAFFKMLIIKFVEISSFAEINHLQQINLRKILPKTGSLHFLQMVIALPPPLQHQQHLDTLVRAEELGLPFPELHRVMGKNLLPIAHLSFSFGE